MSEGPAPSTVAELLARHPWPAEWADAPRLEFLWTYDVPGEPAAIWRLLSDTSRINRAMGLAPMEFREEGGRRLGRARNGGVAHEWTEHPWTWVAGQWHATVREYTRGFPKLIYGVQRVDPHGDGTRVSIYFGAVARSWLGKQALRIGFPSIGKAYARVLPRLAAQIARAQTVQFELPAPTLTPGGEALLVSARAELLAGGLPAVAVEGLCATIRAGDDQDVARVQVRERARAWQVPVDDALRTALHATRLGLLELSWDVVCPHCRGVREEVGALGEVGTQATCEPCDAVFATDQEEAIEITFHIHPKVREVPKVLFCSAEPARKDHVQLQLAVAAGGHAKASLALTRGLYRLRQAGHPQMGLVESVAAPAEELLEVRAGAIAAETRVGPGVTVHLRNESAAAAMFVLEQTGWSDDALRPRHLLSHREFRDLFSDEYLGADVRIAVGEQTLLFTDMVGSTEFYATQGDPAAFAQVKRHFDELFAIVREHGGAVIKTIGDACMAAFTDPLAAVKAAHAMHVAFPPGRTDLPIRLRISLNTGSCIAVRLNANLDYFGGTVNVCAKLQALAESWQVALGMPTVDAPGVRAFLEAHGGLLEADAYESSALPAPIPALRWTVFAAP